MRGVMLLCLLVLSTAAAKADTVVTFDVTGTGTVTETPPFFTNGPYTYWPEGTASGSFTYDFTTDSLVSSDVVLSDGMFSTYLTFNQLVLAPDQPCDLGLYYCETGALTPDGGSFILQDATEYYQGRVIQDYTGIFDVASAPEPPGLFLLGSGMLVFVCARCWRLRRV